MTDRNRNERTSKGNPTSTHRIQMGRSVKPLPEPKPESRLQRQVEAREAREAEIRSLKAQLAEEKNRNDDQEHAANCEAIAKDHAAQNGLDAIGTRKLCNIVENRRRDWVGQGKTRKHFPYNDVIKAALARLVEGRLPPPDKAPRRVPKTFEQVAREREAYLKKLRELGLRDPGVGMPGDPRGFNMG